jgi:hypothetical protein
MKQRLESLVDKPVILRTLPEDSRWEPIRGTIFEVRDDAVDVLLGTAVMKTVRLAMIVDVTIDEREARNQVLEEPPSSEAYRFGKRRLFEAEQAQYLSQPAETVRARAAAAAEALRKVRVSEPAHRGVEQMLERAHFLATGRYDYEVDAGATGGELRHHYYRWAKERAQKLDEALRLRRPEDEVAGHVEAIGRYAGRALAKYPNHAELRAWLDRAESIRRKLSEEVRRSNRITEPFSPGSR